MWDDAQSMKAFVSACVCFCVSEYEKIVNFLCHLKVKLFLFLQGNNMILNAEARNWKNIVE